MTIFIAKVIVALITVFLYLVFLPVAMVASYCWFAGYHAYQFLLVCMGR
jgi:hypothetical protein